MNKKLSFEQGVHRLEKILEKMNSENVTLEESIHLYEESDELIALCNDWLEKAEKKIEKLVKKKDGTLLTDEKDTPLVESFFYEDVKKGYQE